MFNVKKNELFSNDINYFWLTIAHLYDKVDHTKKDLSRCGRYDILKL